MQSCSVKLQITYLRRLDGALSEFDERQEGERDVWWENGRKCQVESPKKSRAYCFHRFADVTESERRSRYFSGSMLLYVLILKTIAKWDIFFLPTVFFSPKKLNCVTPKHKFCPGFTSLWPFPQPWWGSWMHGAISNVQIHLCKESLGLLCPSCYCSPGTGSSSVVPWIPFNSCVSVWLKQKICSH